MKDTRLLQIFQNVKETICKYDYYIHTAKKIIHLSNTENKIPHLMGLQYAGRPKQYTGDFGAYAIKKGRITMQSLEKLVQKYYKTEEKQHTILEVIHLKLDNLSFLPEMFASYSKLYLYDLGKRADSDFDSDYLMVHEMEDRILHLGIIKTGRQEKDLCQCNSFMATYKKDKNSDSFFRDLPYCYEINRIVREDKITKRAEVIYLGSMAECRERIGIEKMLLADGIRADEKLVTEIVKVNLKFGVYHTMDMLNDSEALLEKCTDKRDKNLVSDFLALWEERKNGV